jgi:hypothetical protein
MLNLIFAGNHLPNIKHRILTEELVHSMGARLEIPHMPEWETVTSSFKFILFPTRNFSVWNVNSLWGC